MTRASQSDSHYLQPSVVPSAKAPDTTNKTSPGSAEKIHKNSKEYAGDAHGTLLKEGDTVSLIKDLKVKGSSTVLKVGTKAKITRFLGGDHNIDCRLHGAGAMELKSEFVKKTSD